MRSHWLDKWENEQEKQDEEFNERVAIMEYDGNMTRQDAEILAMKLLAEKYPLQSHKVRDEYGTVSDWLTKILA